MVHLRIVAPDEKGRRALELLEGSGSVCNVIVFPDAARKPRGDVLMCDVAREDASAIIEDLRRLDIPSDGSIALEYVDSEISEAAERAVEYAPGLPSDAVVWEEVEARTEEMTEFSLSFMAFMVLAMLIASVGILLDQPILIVGAMVVGPEFGPLAALSVAIVERRGALVRRSVRALAVGFPVGILVTVGVTLALEAAGQIPDRFDPSDHPLTSFISDPGFFSVFVAFIAGTAGVLSLTSAKSGALIGVLISVTTIPAAANIGVGVALGEWGEAGGAAAQLGLNLAAILLAGVSMLFAQRRWYLHRRRSHDHSAAGAVTERARRNALGSAGSGAGAAQPDREKAAQSATGGGER